MSTSAFTFLGLISLVPTHYVGFHLNSHHLLEKFLDETDFPEGRLVVPFTSIFLAPLPVPTL